MKADEEEAMSGISAKNRVCAASILMDVMVRLDDEKEMSETNKKKEIPETRHKSIDAETGNKRGFNYGS